MRNLPQHTVMERKSTFRISLDGWEPGTSLLGFLMLSPVFRQFRSSSAGTYIEFEASESFSETGVQVDSQVDRSTRLPCPHCIRTFAKEVTRHTHIKKYHEDSAYLRWRKNLTREEESQ